MSISRPDQTLVSFSDLIKFIFPSHIQHPISGPRLYLLAEYGPLYPIHSLSSCLCLTCQRYCHQHHHQDSLCQKLCEGKIVHCDEFHLNQKDNKMETKENDTSFSQSPPWICSTCLNHIDNILHLRSGYLGKHLVTEEEMKQMEKKMVKNDILSLFFPLSSLSMSLSFKQQEEFFQSLPLTLKQPPHYTIEEIYSVCKPFFNDNEQIIFHQLSSIILVMREKRLKEIQKTHSSSSFSSLPQQSHLTSH